MTQPRYKAPGDFWIEIVKNADSSHDKSLKLAAKWQLKNNYAIIVRSTDTIEML